MKKIKLTQGRVALIDDEDFGLVSEYKWNVSNGYVWSRKGNYLHRLILNAPKTKHVDHINGNKLDNRRGNLRLCTRSQNLLNSKMRKHNTSGYRWVSWSDSNGGWVVRMHVGEKYIWGGTFKDKLEAAKKANKLATLYFGELARLNDL